MNSLEKFFYDILKTTPWLKFFIRNLYQLFFDLLPRKQNYSINHIQSKETFFFGFHDKSPFSKDCKMVLSNHLTNNSLRMPLPKDKIEVGYFELNLETIGDYIKLGESFAWNFHKGCRLQWVDSKRVIFNTSINDALVSKIINIETLEERVIDFPIDTISENGEWATSLSYERLERFMPGYGYPYKDSGFIDRKYPNETGLFLININDNTRRLILSLKKLVDDIDDVNLQGFNHYVTHSEFSHDGKYISFLHRWTLEDIRERKTRLVIYDTANDNYTVAPTQGMVSHYVWNKTNQIIAYCNVDGVDCHVLFDVKKLSNYSKIVPNILNSDGHQSFITDTKFITDTYPDKYRMAKIYSVDINTNKVKLIVSQYSPKKYQTKNFNNHIACDLHPRVSPNQKFISFDSVVNNNRSFCLMPIND